MSWCVYKHTNRRSGKVYIGRCLWPCYQDRWKNGYGYRSAPAFWPEIEKYGWDAFDHEILASDLTLNEANRIEKEMISQHRSNDPVYGYNVCAGGTGFTGGHHSADTRRRISKKLREYEITEEHRRHLSESKTGIKHPLAKRVYQLTKDGKLIRSWDYMQQACDELGIRKENVSACCRGLRPSAGGYKWTYVWG